MTQNNLLKILPLLISSFFYFTSCAQEIEYAVPPGQFSHIQPMSEGLMSAKAKKDGLYGFINAGGEWKIPAQYHLSSPFSEGLASVVPEGADLYGYINKTGKLVIETRFKDTRPFSCGRAIVWLPDGKGWACIDSNGKIIFTAESIKAEPTSMPNMFKEGLLEVFQADKDNNFRHGFADTAGRLVIPYQYSNTFYFSDNVAVVTVTNKSSNSNEEDEYHAIIDKKGTTLLTIANNKQDVTIFKTGIARFLENGHYGLMDKKGTIRLAPRFDVLPPDYNGGPLWGIIHGKADGSKEGFLYLLDSNFTETGKLLLYTTGKRITGTEGNFSEGLLAVRQDELWGYVDQSGKWVIQPQFTEAAQFYEGLAIVRNSESIVSIIKNPLKKN